MIEPHNPLNENERLKELLEHEILDTMPEVSFDDLVKIASIVCKTPISLISMLDTDRQWFKARVGVNVQELPREISFCGHAINQSDVFIVGNSDIDKRFCDNPIVVGDPYVKFYAGAPLISSQGHAFGTICVIDKVPRELSEEQVSVLRLLGRQVVQVMELRKHTLERNKVIEELKSLSKTVLDQKEKLVYLEKLEILSSMAAGICHEINNPLAVISLSSDSVKRFFMAQASGINYLPEISKLEKVSRSVDRIEKIVEALKTYSIKKDSPNKEVILLKDIISDALLFCEDGIKKSGIKLTIKNPDGLKIHADRSQIIQVLLNLLINAKDAISSLKEKWIRIEAVASAKPDFVQLRILDSGAGIEPETAAKMMDPFFTTKEIGKGSGVGLSICQGIISSHGGNLFYKISDGHTCFVIELPLAGGRWDPERSH